MSQHIRTVRAMTTLAAGALSVSGALSFAGPAHAAPCERNGKAIGTCVDITMATPITDEILQPGAHQLQATARQTDPARGLIRDLEWWLISPDFSDQHPENTNDKILLDGKNDVNVMNGSFTGSFTVPADGIFTAQRDGDFDGPPEVRDYVLRAGQTYRVEAHALDQEWHSDFAAGRDTGQPPGVSPPAFVTFDVPGTGPQPAVDFTRLAGPDRYSTAVEISRSAFSGARTRVFVASGESFPDALSAAPIAAYNNAPLLLVPGSGTLPGVVANELRRLGAGDITIVGGESAVSAGMESALAEFGDTQRYAGANRYETAVVASAQAGRAGGTVLLASGVDFPDALAGAAAAGELGATLLLTDPGSLPAATRKGVADRKPVRIVVLGGVAAVSANVVDQLSAIAAGSTIDRVAGKDRYQTAAAVSRLAFPSTGAAGVLLATGADFPDALAGAAIAGPTNRPLLLTTANCAPAATVDEIARLGTRDVTALGGIAVISDRAGNLGRC